MNGELIQKLEAWASAYERGECNDTAGPTDLKEHALILREAIAALSAK